MLRVTEEEAELLMGKVPLPTQHSPKYKRKTKPQAEKGITNACLELLWTWNVFCWRNNTGGFLRTYKRKDNSEGRSFIRFGYKGSGDIIGLTNKTGRFLAVENKTVNGQLDDDQEKFRDYVLSRGGVYILARGTDTLELHKKIIIN